MGGEVRITEAQRLLTRCARRGSFIGRCRRIISRSSKTMRGSGGGPRGFADGGVVDDLAGEGERLDILMRRTREGFEELMAGWRVVWLRGDRDVEIGKVEVVRA